MRKIIVALVLISSIIPLAAHAQKIIPIWGSEAPPLSIPHELEEYDAECWGEPCVHQVVNPTLTLYFPENPTNANAVIVLPGGGYEVEAIEHEGHRIANTLAEQGTVAAVLKYRLPNPVTSSRPEKVPLADVRKALSLLRQHPEIQQRGIERFGVMGFSAGSHLATVASLFPSLDEAQNPDFSMLIYGVTRLTPENLEWLEKTLYHRTMTPSEIADMTLLNQVTATTPPAFMVHSLDDDVCHYSETTLYAEALTEQGIEAEVHLFARGGHGFGPGRAEDGTDQWLQLASAWLNRLDGGRK